MFPMWIFLVLIAVIVYRLYKTRVTEEDIVMLTKQQRQALQYKINEKVL